jgi:hypothetical protein
VFVGVSSNFSVVEVVEGCSVAGVGGNQRYLGCKRAYWIVFAYGLFLCFALFAAL